MTAEKDHELRHFCDNVGIDHFTPSELDTLRSQLPGNEPLKLLTTKNYHPDCEKIRIFCRDFINKITIDQQSVRKRLYNAHDDILDKISMGNLWSKVIHEYDFSAEHFSIIQFLQVSCNIFNARGITKSQYSIPSMKDYNNRPYLLIGLKQQRMVELFYNVSADLYSKSITVSLFVSNPSSCSYLEELCSRDCDTYEVHIFNVKMSEIKKAFLDYHQLADLLAKDYSIIEKLIDDYHPVDAGGVM